MRSVILQVLALFVLLLPVGALAQDLVPPQPGLTIKFSYPAGLMQTITVIAVDGMETEAEGVRSDTPTFKAVLRSYRVWYTRRAGGEDGTLYQDSPTAMLDQFATLAVGTVRVFPAKLRYEPAANRPNLPGGQANRAWTADVTMTYEVERKESVTVPAGTFDAFVLKRTQLFAVETGKATRREYTRIWFAPELRWWVKLESKSELPDRPAVIAEAVEIKRP